MKKKAMRPSSLIRCGSMSEGTVWSTTSEDNSGKPAHKPAADILSPVTCFPNSLNTSHLQELTALEDRETEDSRAQVSGTTDLTKQSCYNV